MINCHYCNYSCEEYKDLAQHIVANKDSQHRKGRIWAAKFLTRADFLNHKADQQKQGGRVALTPEEQASKENIIRELSGETAVVRSINPE